MHISLEELAKMRNKMQVRLPKEEDQDQFDRDRSNDKRNILHSSHHPSPKENNVVHRPPLTHTPDAESITPAPTNFQHLYETQSKELDVLRHEHGAALEEQKRLASAYESLKQEYEERSRKLDEVRQECEEARAQRINIEDTYAALKQQYEERVRDVRATPEPKEEQITPVSTTFQHMYETQSKELSVLRHEHEAALEEHTRLVNAYESFKEQDKERSKDLDAVHQECHEAQAQRKELGDAHALLKQQYEERTKELEAIRHERQVTLEQKQEMEEDYTALVEKYETQRNGYGNLRNKFQSLKASLERRTSELQGSQKFLMAAGVFSGSEVASMLRRLNEDVQQNATFMAEWAVERFVPETAPTDQITTQTIEENRTSVALGMEFMELLSVKRHPILVEIGFQAYLVYELHRVAAPWNIGEKEQSHTACDDDTCQRWDTEAPRATFENWHARPRSDPEPPHKVATTIISGFSDILLAAGCTIPKSDTMAELQSKFAENIQHLVSVAQEINKIIDVGVIWEDFEVQVVRPNMAFNAKTMEDSYVDDTVERTEKETVLCATELGLTQRMRVGAGMGQNGILRGTIIMKPKVALASVVDVIDK